MTRFRYCALSIVLNFVMGCNQFDSEFGATVLRDALIGSSDLQSTAILVAPSQCVTCNAGLTDAISRIRGGDKRLVLVSAARPTEQEARRLRAERVELRMLSEPVSIGIRRGLPLAIWRTPSSGVRMAPLRSPESVRRLAESQ